MSNDVILIWRESTTPLFLIKNFVAYTRGLGEKINMTRTVKQQIYKIIQHYNVTTIRTTEFSKNLLMERSEWKETADETGRSIETLARYDSLRGNESNSCTIWPCRSKSRN